MHTQSAIRAGNAEDPLITLESDKATMDVPAPTSGAVTELLVKVGDEVEVTVPSGDKFYLVKKIEFI